MKKILAALIFIILLIAPAIAQTRSYTLQSLDDNGLHTVSIKDIGHETAIIRYKRSKLVIHNFWAEDTISVVKNRFIAIKYFLRGGSDMRFQNMLLICINKNRLIIPLIINSEQISSLHAVDSDTDTVMFDEESKYQVKTTLVKTDINNYKISLAVTDFSKSKNNPKANYNKHEQVNLKLDKNFKVFYNDYKTFNKSYKITSCSYPSKTNIKLIKGTFPSVFIMGALGQNQSAYYINQHWYTKSKKNSLVACY